MRRTGLGLLELIFIFQMYKSKKETCTILEPLMDYEAVSKDNEKIIGSYQIETQQLRGYTRGYTKTERG